MWFDLGVSALEDLSREELIALAREQDARIAELTDRLAELEHLLSRSSSNSSMPPSRDDDVGRTPPKPRSGGASKRSRGKQPGRTRLEPSLARRAGRAPRPVPAGLV
jgi:transposase